MADSPGQRHRPLRSFTVQRILLSFMLASSVAIAQQPNSPEASLIIERLDRASVPIVAALNVNSIGSTFDVELSGTADQAFVLALAPAGVLPAGASTPAGLVDLDLSQGLDVLFDGTGLFLGGSQALFARTDLSGSWRLELPIVPSRFVLQAAIQALVQDPTHPSGVRLTAATDVRTFSASVPVIYASETSGSPQGDGSISNPFRDLDDAIQAAETAAAMGVLVEIRLAEGNYNLVSNHTLPADVAIRGGYRPGTWVPRAGVRSLIDVGSTALLIDGASQLTVFERLHVRAAAASGATGANPSSIAVAVRQAGSFLRFRSCTFEAGNGAPGADGADAGPRLPRAAPGRSASGFNGGGCSFGSPAVSAPTSCGGLGARTPGMPGESGGGRQGAGGASAILCGQSGANGSPGAPLGATGAYGIAGALGPVGGTFINGQWTPAASVRAAAPGSDGEYGSGGGGGGCSLQSGTCQVLPGGGGGQGGEAGRGGDPGGNGESGGGSLAMTLFMSSPSIEDCTFITKSGGDGGDGGDPAAGQDGGSGGSGAPGTFSPLAPLGLKGGDGGDGGVGGRGGTGGAGSGGHGGPSFGIYRDATSAPVFSGLVQFVIGQGGVRGEGGFRSVPGGLPAFGFRGVPGQSGSVN